MAERVGFISTRFAGMDGVSLESAKWAQILWEDGHVSHWYAGRMDRSPDISLCIPEAYFGHPENLWIHRHLWGSTARKRLITQRIRDVAAYLKTTLYEFVQRFDISLLILENAVSIPMHVPLGIAITEFLAETRIPAIAHHHDFYWERTRFSVNAVHDYLEMAFPPRDPSLKHVVINQAAQEELSWRKGVPSMLIPNVLDFENPPRDPDEYASDALSTLGFSPDDIIILQPTRIVPRKGIEHAIKLVQMLDDRRYKLVVSHEAGDEGMEYHDILKEMADEEGVDLHFIATRIGDVRQLDSKGRKIYTLWDLYPHADLISYPSLYEGFGNAFLEAVYFRKPALINRYAIFARDLEPKGFEVPVIDGFVTRRVIEEVRTIMENPEYRQKMVDHNYAIARRFYSYSVLRRGLRTLLTEMKGMD